MGEENRARIRSRKPKGEDKYSKKVWGIFVETRKTAKL